MRWATAALVVGCSFAPHDGSNGSDGSGSDGSGSGCDGSGNAPPPGVGVARAANSKWETNPCVNSEVFACECDPQYPTQ